MHLRFFNHRLLIRELSPDLTLTFPRSDLDILHIRLSAAYRLPAIDTFLCQLNYFILNRLTHFATLSTPSLG